MKICAFTGHRPKSLARAFDFFFINAGMTQTVEDPRLATGGWLDLTTRRSRLYYNMFCLIRNSGKNVVDIALFVERARRTCRDTLSAADAAIHLF